MDPVWNGPGDRDGWNRSLQLLLVLKKLGQLSWHFGSSVVLGHVVMDWGEVLEDGRKMVDVSGFDLILSVFALSYPEFEIRN